MIVIQDPATVIAHANRNGSAVLVKMSPYHLGYAAFRSGAAPPPKRSLLRSMVVITKPPRANQANTSIPVAYPNGPERSAINAIIGGRTNPPSAPRPPTSPAAPPIASGT